MRAVQSTLTRQARNDPCPDCGGSRLRGPEGRPVSCGLCGAPAGLRPALRGSQTALGDRNIKSLSLAGYTIKNRLFENTISVPRTKVEDDTCGVFAPLMEQMGLDAALFPDELVFGLIATGFTQFCYDGQYFFDTDHAVGPVSAPVSVSNMQAGAGPAWYLLDCSQPIRPLIFQERIPAKFTQKTEERDDNVFMRDEYLYGTRARCNVGFGLWQLAYASKQDLTPANYAAARVAMQSQFSDSGRPLGVSPTHLVFPPALEEKARLIVNVATNAAGATNPWAGTAKPVMSQYLIAA